jgi:DNA (cytosine-5)-methyltransferase 1
VNDHLDLCSGIGGFALGLQNTGYFKTSAFCEIDPYCQQVLKKNFPDIPIYSDIRELNPIKEKLKPDIITAGFPCQPFSVAGRQKGKDDNRNLWKETFRIIKESKPTWFIGENVSGIIKLYLDTILEDLESANYSTRCFIISAQSIGAKHKRERIWIVANSRRLSRGDKYQGDQKMPRQESTFAKTEWSRNTSEIDRSDSRAETLSDSKSDRTGESRNINQKKRIKESNESQLNSCSSIIQNTNNIGTKLQTKRELSSFEIFRGSSQTNWWEIECKLCGTPNGLSTGLDKDRVKRIKGLGNAIVPQIPFYIGQAIGRFYE